MVARKHERTQAEAPLLVIPDCNVLMHGKPLAALPWSEVTLSPIEVMLVTTVVREIDSLKMKPGRTGKTARALSAGIRMLVGAPDMRAELAQTPAVSWRIVRERVSELFGQGLDLHHNDDAIINHALSIKASGGRTLFLTGDTIAFVTAQSHGLDSLLLPDHWLKAPEPDEQAKALKLAQAEVARLKATQPQPRLWFADRAGVPIERLDVTLPCYDALDRNLVESLMERVEAVAPIIEVALTTFDIADGERDLMKIGEAYEAAIEAAGGYLPVTQSDIDAYHKAHAEWLQQVRTKLDRLHGEWRERRETPVVQLVVVNEGSRPAESALFEIEARGQFHLRRPFDGSDIRSIEAKKQANALELPSPPPAPRRRSRIEALMSDHSLFGRTLPPLIETGLPRLTTRDSDAIYWESKRGRPAGLLSLSCGNWRHQRAPEDFTIEVVVEDDRDQKGAIVARINANNMTEPLELILPVTIKVETRDTARIAQNLIDDFERRQTAPPKPLPEFSWRLPPGKDRV